ncbi:hypothetical protein [Hippea sp. KM1]|uniref:hypothetical protein n=1 Tax=Hippea sp. KM1 TaxID=944481 RepID=UPI00046D2600|nr:hypothetical protein [Hippea sp. KM1]
MAIKVDNYLNEYVVNQLFKNDNNKNNSSDIVGTLQTLGQKYATISAFGKKLNDIYTTLSQQEGISEQALAGARDVIVSLANSDSDKWMETTQALDEFKNSDKFSELFEAAHTIKTRNYDLNEWLNGFVNTNKYGFADEFITETNTILGYGNTTEAASLFEDYVNMVNDIAKNAPNEDIVANTYSTFFKGMASYSSIEEKNAFMDTFKAQTG